MTKNDLNIAPLVDAADELHGHMPIMSARTQANSSEINNFINVLMCVLIIASVHTR